MSFSGQRSHSPDVESDREIEILHHEQHRAHPEKADIDRHKHEILTFETHIAFTNDPNAPNLTQYDSPFGWSRSRKNVILIFCCLATFFAAYSAGSYSITSGPLRGNWNVSSEAYQTGITTWCVGFACSPMFLAPLSELKGRRPVFLFSGFMFFVATIGCAVTNSFAGMLVARFFVGAGASTFATMVGGVLSDIFHAEDRNAPMALYSAHALAGTGVGPLVCGFIVPRVSWHWVFWHQAIALGIMMTLMAIFFKETRGSVLLARKLERVNKYLDELESEQHAANTLASDKAGFDVSKRYTLPSSATTSSLTHLLYLSLTTPFKLLITEPVVFFFSLWAAFAWGVLYLQLNVLPLVFSTNHQFTVEQTGAVFASLVVGVLIAVTLSIYQESFARKHYPKLLQQPEGRLYFACLEAALLPIGLFIFGWTSPSSIPWIAPCIGIATAMVGIFSIYLAVFNYLADVYHRYASSALACQSFCRNILAAVFPLFSEQMFRSLGFPGASSLLGGVAAVLTLVPWVLVFKGETIRRRSKVAREIMEAHG